MLITLLLPTAGRASVLGHDVEREPREIRKRIGYVFGGDRGLYERLSALDNLRYFAELYGVSGRAQRVRIAEVLELVGLTGREKERVEGYSRGMRQRLHIARGILHDPEVVFLDEPTIGVDPVGARELRSTISELVAAGKTVLLTTHYMFEADALCDRIAVIAKGRIVGQGTPAELKSGVTEGRVTEIEVFGVDDASVDRLRALDGVTSRRRRGPRAAAGPGRPVDGRARADARAARGARRCLGGPGLVARADARGRLRRARDGRMSRPTEVWRMTSVRIVWRGFVFLMKRNTTSSWFLMLAIFQPLIFATIAFYMFESGGKEGTLLYAALGAGMMGIWSSTLFGSGGAHPVVAVAGDARARRRRAAAVHPRAAAADALGDGDRDVLAGSDARVGPARVRRPAPPRAPVAARGGGPRDGPLARADGAADGVVLHPLPARERAHRTCSSTRCGSRPACVFPIALLPGWAQPLSWLLAPRWGIEAIRGAALGGAVAGPLALHRRPRPRLPRARRALPARLRAARPRPRDALADVTRRALSSWLRIFFVGGVIAYRALFNWIRPSIYIPTMLGAPLFQILFFTYLGRYATDQPRLVLRRRQRGPGVRDVEHLRDDAWRSRTSAGPGRSGRCSRRRRTVRRSSSAAASPCSRTALVVSAFGFVVGAVLLDFRPGLGRGSGARRLRPRERDRLHRLRDPARVDRPPREGLHLRGEPRRTS